MFFQIISFFTNFYTEIMVVQGLFCLMFPKKKYWWLSVALWVVLDIALFFIPNLYSLNGVFVVFGWLNFIFPIVLACSTLFFSCTVKIPAKDLVFYTSAAYAVQNFVHNISYIVTSFFGYNPRDSWGFVITLAIYLAALTCVYFFIVRRIRRGEIVAVANYAIILLSASTLIITFFLSMYFLPNGYSNNIARFYAALCCLFLLFIQFSLFEKSRAERDRDTVENLLYAERKQYDVWKSNVDIINIKCHDLKHQMSHILKIEDAAARRKSFDDVKDAIMIYDGFVKTGNQTLDTILTEKSMICERNKITYSFLADGKKLDFIDEYDMCSLFGNILDNAIESASKVENEELRTIALNVNCTGNILSIHCDNSCVGTVKLVNGVPETSKSDKRYHGFGVKSIQMIVEKYDGSLVITPKENNYNIDIIFLLKDAE